MRFGKFLTRACITLLVAVLVFLSTMTLPLMQPPVAAQSNGKGASKAPRPASKLSDDLRDRIGKSRPNAEIPTIVQTSGKPSRLLQDDLKRQGGKVKRTFNNLNVISISMPAGALAALAARSDVSHISLDRGTQVTGHIEEATGADQVRSFAASPTGQ